MWYLLNLTAPVALLLEQSGNIKDNKLGATNVTIVTLITTFQSTD